MNAALLVIDIQRWFRKTRKRQEAFEPLIEKTNDLIDLFHERNLPIFHVLTVHKADGSTGDLWMKRNKVVSLVEGTEDAEEIPEVHTFDTDVVITKHRHSAFIGTNLENMLRDMDVDAVVLTGYSTNACVGLTAIDAYERDFDVMLAGDAILGVNEERANLMLKYLRMEFGFEPVSNDRIIEITNAF